MFGVLHEVMQTAFDYEIEVDQPKSLDSENKNWKVSLTVMATANDNLKFCENYL